MPHKKNCLDKGKAGCAGHERVWENEGLALPFLTHGSKQRSPTGHFYPGERDTVPIKQDAWWYPQPV
jgi:hypothetical protein